MHKTLGFIPSTNNRCLLPLAPVYTSEYRWVLLPPNPLSYGAFVFLLHELDAGETLNPCHVMQMATPVFSWVPICTEILTGICDPAFCFQRDSSWPLPNSSTKIWWLRHLVREARDGTTSWWDTQTWHWALKNSPGPAPSFTTTQKPPLLLHGPPLTACDCPQLTLQIACALPKSRYE